MAHGQGRRAWAGAAAVIAAGLSSSGTPAISAEPGQTIARERFEVEAAAEVIAALTATCAGCDWGTTGREAAVLRLSVDGRYSQDLPLVQGPGPRVYRVALGGLTAGTHTLEAALDPVSAPGARDVRVDGVAFERVTAGAPEHEALAHAPILHQRANAVGRFTDVPLLMYYEVEPAGARTRIRYSVVFSNEDGGTPPDRLMATWGRVTDIELVYAVELDAAGSVTSELYQGKDHAMPAFAGAREGRHPLLFVVTDNNMLADRGDTLRRHRPAPQRVDLRDVSREAFMDAHPWTYRVMAEEVRREGRIAEAPPPGSAKIPDPRRFLYVEGCGEVHDAQIALDVAFVRDGRREWAASDAADPRFRVARDGCFRAAVALPAGTRAEALQAVRVRAHTRLPGRDEARLPAGTGWARLTRINRAFLLNDDYTPGPDRLTWTGDARLPAEGPALELPFPPP